MGRGQGWCGRSESRIGSVALSGKSDGFPMVWTWAKWDVAPRWLFCCHCWDNGDGDCFFACLSLVTGILPEMLATISSERYGISDPEEILRDSLSLTPPPLSYLPCDYWLAHVCATTLSLLRASSQSLLCTLSTSLFPCQKGEENSFPGKQLCV